MVMLLFSQKVQLKLNRYLPHVKFFCTFRYNKNKKILKVIKINTAFIEILSDLKHCAFFGKKVKNVTEHIYSDGTST